MIEIKYFGPLATELDCAEESWAWHEHMTTASLLSELQQRGERWQQALAENKIFKFAVNGSICHQITAIPDGAEVGILPPVTGG
ncbi:MoaD/ThiS family protein [Brackiella oedipodis]|uniref:MoaD/ThiS family protein n=1 Tax=Brackiella oedipodis TaxID=124225 RepID=UPI000491D6F5|nr:MoaD/ThiS family protein [Brackiella oedipodis]